MSKGFYITTYVFKLYMVFGSCDAIIIREYKVRVGFHFSWNNPLLIFPKNARKNCMTFLSNHPSLRSIKLAAFITKSLHKVFCLETRVSSSSISCMILFCYCIEVCGFFILVIIWYIAIKYYKQPYTAHIQTP